MVNIESKTQSNNSAFSDTIQHKELVAFQDTPDADTVDTLAVDQDLSEKNNPVDNHQFFGRLLPNKATQVPKDNLKHHVNEDIEQKKMKKNSTIPNDFTNDREIISTDEERTKMKPCNKKTIERPEEGEIISLDRKKDLFKHAI